MTVTWSLNCIYITEVTFNSICCIHRMTFPSIWVTLLSNFNEAHHLLWFKTNIYMLSLKIYFEPLHVPGCEYYYNPALKKQKEEEKKQIASKLGADVSSNDFSQFLKLLKMSGVLNGDSEAAIKATLKNQNKRGPLRGKRPGIGGRRPGGRRPGGRRKPPRRRPTTPRPVYYDDYYYDYDYLYEDEPPITSGRGFQDSKAIKSNRNPSIISQVGRLIIDFLNVELS